MPLSRRRRSSSRVAASFFCRVDGVPPSEVTGCLTQDRVNALKLPYQLLPDAARSLQACGLRFLTETDDLEEDQEVSSIAQQDHPLLTGANDSDHEHAPSPTDVFAAEPYERSPKKKQRVA